MPIVRIIKNEGRFMEGWEAGQIVEMDDQAAAGPLAEGVVELVKPEVVEKPKKTKVTKPTA